MSKINNTHGDGYHFDENFDISKFLRDKHTEERNNKRRRLDNNINNNNKNRQTFGVPFDLICGSCNQLTGRGSLVYMTKSPAIEEDNNNNLNNNNNNNTSSTTPTAPPKPPKKKILKYLDKITIFDIKFKCKKCSAVVIIRTDYATPTLTGGYVPFYNCTRLSWGDEEDDEDNNNNNNNIIDNISNNISISNAKTVVGVSDAERRASDRLRRDIEEGGRTILIRERSAVDYDAERDRLMLGIMNNNNTSNNNSNNNTSNNNNEKENEKESNNNNNSDNDINDDISNEYSSDGDMCWGSDGEGDLTPPHLGDLMANGSDNITDNRGDNNILISNNNNNSNPSVSTKTDWGNRYQYQINNNKSINSNNNIPGNKSDESAEGTEALFARVLGLANSAGDNNNNNNNNNNKAHEDRKRTRGKTQQHKTRVMSNEDFLAQL